MVIQFDPLRGFHHERPFLNPQNTQRLAFGNPPSRWVAGIDRRVRGASFSGNASIVGALSPSSII